MKVGPPNDLSSPPSAFYSNSLRTCAHSNKLQPLLLTQWLKSRIRIIKRVSQSAVNATVHVSKVTRYLAIGGSHFSKEKSAFRVSLSKKNIFYFHIIHFFLFPP